ncbi:hypothetical protein ATCR1_14881 [Agrobacterium tumefaciens CCNWGS0286]|uniref:hypothetical protein n=1 Tax=Agrobacterium tumefaciens TaxID=358 RepID=UPI0002334630|nr:hypothetical protein [Agrobacterium tumefaciens]EHH05425.1 hypothetical protein ATCR1_14881 [Agrobacterium tumefaciens CCNWGS0286]
MHVQNEQAPCSSDLLLELQLPLEIAILLEDGTVDGVEMSFNVNDLGAGYDNVTSQFALPAKDQTVLLFRTLLGESEYETLVSSGKAKCFPIHIVPAYLQMGGKLWDTAIAIPTRHPVSTYGCRYYLFDCGSREINARPEARDKKYPSNYAIVTRLDDIKVLDNSKRQDGCRYISNVNYDIVKQFLS